MPQADLKGKTVMIVAPDQYKLHFRGIKTELESLGAKVVYSRNLSFVEKNILEIGDEVEFHNPKIDALIIFNQNIALPSSKIVTIDLANRLKKSLPVIVCDVVGTHRNTQPIQDTGARYLDLSEIGSDRIAFVVADAVAQHGKPGQRVGG
jgi:hypothetical protein